LHPGTSIPIGSRDRVAALQTGGRLPISVVWRGPVVVCPEILEQHPTVFAGPCGCGWFQSCRSR
jgi:hypothetical protein